MFVFVSEFEAKSCACLYQEHDFLIAFRTVICCTIFPLPSFLWCYFKAVTDYDLAKMGQKFSLHCSMCDTLEPQDFFLTLIWANQSHCSETTY